eukprot:8723553-Pyramimonas_sp.AAC.1
MCDDCDSDGELVIVTLMTICATLITMTMAMTNECARCCVNEYECMCVLMMTMMMVRECVTVCEDERRMRTPRKCAEKTRIP